MINYIKDRLEIQFWKLAKWLIIRGYGCYCTISDLDEGSWYTTPKDVFRNSRCPSCRAKEICDWIDGHITSLTY